MFIAPFVSQVFSARPIIAPDARRVPEARAKGVPKLMDMGNIHLRFVFSAGEQSELLVEPVLAGILFL
jgi:hypothetical protein